MAEEIDTKPAFKRFHAEMLRAARCGLDCDTDMVTLAGNVRANRISILEGNGTLHTHDMVYPVDAGMIEMATHWITTKILKLGGPEVQPVAKQRNVVEHQDREAVLRKASSIEEAAAELGFSIGYTKQLAFKFGVRFARKNARRSVAEAREAVAVVRQPAFEIEPEVSRKVEVLPGIEVYVPEAEYQAREQEKIDLLGPVAVTIRQERMFARGEPVEHVTENHAVDRDRLVVDVLSILQDAETNRMFNKGKYRPKDMRADAERIVNLLGAAP